MGRARVQRVQMRGELDTFLWKGPMGLEADGTSVAPMYFNRGQNRPQQRIRRHNGDREVEDCGRRSKVLEGGLEQGKLP